MTAPVPSLDVAAIRARAEAAVALLPKTPLQTYQWVPGYHDIRQAGDALADVPALLAALEAMSVERDEARAALARIEALRDSVPTDRDIDASLIPLGFHPDEAYPEWSHNHLRIAYREGWEDAADAALRGDQG